MKKVSAISSVLLGIVFLAGCGQKPVSQTQPMMPAPVEQQSTPTDIAPSDQPASIPVQIETDKVTGWQKFTYKSKGVSISVPKNWRNASEIDGHPLFEDANGENSMWVSFPGDEDMLGRPEKELVEIYLSDPEGSRVVKEKLIFGKNTVFKICPWDDIKCLTTSTTYYIRLKNNVGFVEFDVSQGANQSIVKSIFEKIEIY